MRLSDDDRKRIGTAFETIERSLSVLGENQSLSYEEYLDNRTTRDVVERRFVKATEAALDIAKVLVVAELDTYPESNPNAMRGLAEAGILSARTAEKMERAAQFRNALAHKYNGEINHDDVYDALQDLERYRTFLVEVRAYLDDAGLL